VTRLIDPLLDLGTPLTSPFLALLVALLVPVLARSRWRAALKAAALAGTVLGFGLLYHAISAGDGAGRWLAALNTPLVSVYLIVILPAMYLPRNRWYRLFLLLPAAILLLATVSVIENYRAVPEGEWAWFLIRPAWLMGGVASLLVLVQPLLKLGDFRMLVRFACLLVLLYGGMALRTGYDDYREMVARRPMARPGIMNVSETSPALQVAERKTYLPSAPCRFTADGGYVQGCNLELLQRMMQVNWGSVGRGDAQALGDMGILVGALLLFLVLSFAAGRWFCGWVCPLSSLGDVLDWVRKKLRLPHMKPSKPVKLGYLCSGLSLAGITLAMAKAYPHLDAQGKFLGCKIPLYPFCKICPSQQICPVAAAGPGNYPGLPPWADWPFFRIAVLALLAVFAFSFAAGRRLWCRLCPMGMISGVFNRGGLMTLRKNPLKCNRCGVCREVCPMDIDLVRSEMKSTDVSSYDCVLCLRCVEKCPRDECLSLEHAGLKVAGSHFDGKG